MLTLPVQLTVSACEGRGCVCSHCTLCDPHPRRFRPVAGDGPPSARIAIVGEAPGEMEEIKGRPFVGPSGKLLERALTEVGLSRSDCFLTNAVLCRPPGNRDPKTAELAACNQRLLNELHALPNLHVLVILGSSAVKAVMGRTQGITELVTRTEWSEQFSCHVLYSIHPAAILRNPDNYQDLHRTLLRACDLLDLTKAPLAVPRVPYVLETHVSAAVATLRRLYRHATGRIACDIETAGEAGTKDALDWRKGWITNVVLTADMPPEPYMLPVPYILPRRVLFHPEVFPEMRRLFSRRDIEWVWHNGKFDLQFLWAADFVEAHLDTDTMLLHKCLDERSGTHSLKALAGWYFGDGGYGEEKDGFSDPRYIAKDGRYTHLLPDLVRHDLDREPPSTQGYPGPAFRHDHILAPVWTPIAEIERYGVAIDLGYLDTLVRLYEGDPEKGTAGVLAEKERECQELAGVRFPVKQTKTQQKQGLLPLTQPINIRSVPQLRWYFYEHLGLDPVFAKGSKGDDPTTNAEMLKLYTDTSPFIPALLDYRMEQKLYSTYVKGAVEAAAWDGCVHTHFSFNPVTGRPSSADLNIQNIPKKSPIKRLYVARPGRLFAEFDFSNQEVRMAALLSRDPALLTACLSADFHTTTAQGMFAERYAEIASCGDDLDALYGVALHYFRQLAAMHIMQPFTPKELAAAMRDHLRNSAKAVTFGTLYGTGAQGLKDTLWRSKARIDISLEDAEEYILSWLRRFPVCATWRTEQRRAIREGGFVDTPFGHRRRKMLITPETQGDAERQAMNAPIQSLSSDATVRSVKRAHPLLIQRRIGNVLFFVHDSLDCEIEIGRLDEGVALVKEIMEHSLDDIQNPNFYVPFPVEVKVGPGWGELYAEEDTDEGPGWHTRYQGAPFCALSVYAARSA